MNRGKREQIAQAALALFQAQGFTATKMAQIAAAAGMTAANLYVYFDSKLAILYEVYRPWLRAQLDALGAQVRAQHGTHARLRRLLVGLWHDIPGADANFANALIDGLAQRPARAEPSSAFLNEVEVAVGALLRECIGMEHGARVLCGDEAMLSRLIWMAFDGFVINRRLGDVRDVEAVASLIAALVLDAGPGGPPNGARNAPQTAAGARAGAGLAA
ncbi:TetR/AcrR family transcriptional regulator [Paraburkholderia acidisoli]|uniref:TetR family transcriptional regulator n=1 Tax=Paraburkholderia acidisoli TaxID=2571748 RepID=A0A7Z2JI29_9BURK|nr:TetR/AcrR family transcriptional regulator [Paraburkholderia acidisoli]QGZ64748.1 TetR family transcriptional regulator [Paraburkholderia acidisoli]